MKHTTGATFMRLTLKMSGLNSASVEPGPLIKINSKNSGRRVEIHSDQPATQVYTGNWLSDSPVNKSSEKYEDYAGVAIECQGMPDAPNKPTFPSQMLRPGEVYSREIRYIFKVEK